MTRQTQLALMLCVALAGTAVEARADCHYVRGSIAETAVPSNDPFGRLLGTVTGVLNGASTVFITSPPPNVTSYDVFLTTAGDVLIATGVSAPRTPVPGEPGEAGRMCQSRNLRYFARASFDKQDLPVGILPQRE